VISSKAPLTGKVGDAVLSPEERRWLHDKYERLASDEGSLAGSRTSYFAAIGTVLFTGTIWVVANLLTHPLTMAVMITFLGVVGFIISVVWAVLLHRTFDAQNLWREAARTLEDAQPPISAALSAPITLRSKGSLSVDLARPYQAHALRFSPTKGVSWMDRVDPSMLTELLPQTFIVMWVLVIASVWIWYLVPGL
jgi:hypothetical protein